MSNKDCIGLQMLEKKRKEMAELRSKKDDEEWSKDKCIFLKNKVVEQETRISDLEDVVVQIMSAFEDVTGKPFVLR